MKKFILILILSIFNIAFAKIDYKIYEGYVDDISNYSLDLTKLSYNPFFIPQKKKKKIIKESKVHIAKPKPQFKILAILNDKVLLHIKDNGKSRNIWLSKAKKIKDYKLIKITKESVLLKHKNKIEVISINKKMNNFHLKVSK